VRTLLSFLFYIFSRIYLYLLNSEGIESLSIKDHSGISMTYISIFARIHQFTYFQKIATRVEYFLLCFIIRIKINDKLRIKISVITDKFFFKLI